MADNIKCEFFIEKKLLTEEEKKENTDSQNNQQLGSIIDSFTSLSFELKTNNEKSFNQKFPFKNFKEKNYKIVESKIQIPQPNKNLLEVNLTEQNIDNNVSTLPIETDSKIILLIKESGEDKLKESVIHFKNFKRVENASQNIGKDQFKLTLNCNNGNNYEKFGQFQEPLKNPTKIQIIIVQNNNMYERIIEICFVKLKNCLEKNIFGQIDDDDDADRCKIKIEIRDDNQTYEHLFYYWELLRYCKNNEDFYGRIKEFESEKKIILNDINNKKYILKIDLPIIKEYKIEIMKNGKNCLEAMLCDVEEIKTKWKISLVNFLIYLALFIGKCQRLLFQAGDIFISLIILGIFIETETLLITALQAFWSGFWTIIFIINFILIIYAINIVLVLPLAIQFYEAFNLRYIRNKNPLIKIFKIIYKICKYKGNIDVINKRAENIIDLIGFIILILYIIAFSVYDDSPIMLEIINLSIFIIIPCLKILLVFIYNWYLGYNRIINRYCCCKCCDECCCKCCKCCDCYEHFCKIKELKVFLGFDIFEKKNEFNEPIESYEDLDPSSLLMYGEGDNEEADKVFLYIKLVLFSLFILFVIIFYPIKTGAFFIIYFLIFFFLIIFPISMSVPETNLLSCCIEPEILLNNYRNILKKFKGLKYWIYFIRILINLLIAALLVLSAFINDSNNQSINNRLGDEKSFNQISVEDFTEQLMSRKYLKNPMCNTQIHYLNFIQLVALAQAAYINKDDDIKVAKDIFYSSTIFKHSIPKLKNMEFLTKENDNIVILRTDFEIINNRNLIVFSIRGSTSFRDWWLDLEMFSPSVVFTIIKRIPLILKEESLTSEAIKWFLTLPLKGLEDISLLKKYSQTIYDKVDNIIKENNNTDFIFVGHSLGGGLSKYVATHYQVQSFAVSGPGVSPLEYKHKEIYGFNKYFSSSFIDIIPDMDIVPRFEVSNANKYRVLCNKGAFTCHSVDRTLCMMGIMCQQEEYTKKLCLSMPNIGKEEYNDMIKLKNGDKFCDNYVELKENEEHQCKSAKTSNSESKCCYVQLNYPTNTGIAQDRKCLQFREEDKDTYILGFKRKYPTNSNIVLEC